MRRRCESVENDTEVSEPGHLGEWTWPYLHCRPIREAGSGKIMTAFEYVKFEVPVRLPKVV